MVSGQSFLEYPQLPQGVFARTHASKTLDQRFLKFVGHKK